MNVKRPFSSCFRDAALPWARLGLPGARVGFTSLAYSSSSRASARRQSRLLAVGCDISQTAVADSLQQGSPRQVADAEKTSLDYAASLQTFARQMPSTFSEECRQQQRVGGVVDTGAMQECTVTKECRLEQNVGGGVCDSVFDSDPERKGLETVQHFCAKHVGSIRVYMDSLTTRLPIPVAVIPLGE